MSTTIYRYKFSAEFTNQLLRFIEIHRFDGATIFKNEWTQWYAENSEAVQRETSRLVDLGYTGDIMDKMYKSVRYYYKNKPLATKSPKKRRKYIRLGNDILTLMDEHIARHSEKPSVSYNIFIEENKEKIASLKSDLLAKGMKHDDMDVKIKKTFKNRHFRSMGN